MDREDLIRELIERVAGEVGLIIYTLHPKREFTDEELSVELGTEINDVRRALFYLYEVGLADYRRRRDDETGWMEYYWQIRYDREDEILKKELLKTKKKLQEKLKTEESNIYYLCVNGCIKVNYEEAMDLGFTCPRCGAPLEYFDTSSVLEKLREEIKRIDELILSIDRTKGKTKKVA
ncbi:MAG: transcription factor E [Archaeoglobus sp.]|jgi:transcription initiation factor TFIIE subunit alpha|nr:MAG: transcription factor E [Archaeoglobus sp.]